MRSLVTAVLIAAAAPALAAPVEYRFEVALSSGPLAGDTVVGRFTIDDALLVPDFAQYDDFAGGLGILALDVRFGDAVFTRANADAIFLTVEDGELVSFLLGGLPSGLDLISSSDPAADFDADEFGFGYKLAGTDQFIYSGDTIAFARVPAPAGLALFGLGLIALAGRRRIG